MVRDQVSDENGETVQTDDVVLVLDPGMAFGTGLHPTTQNCLARLEDIVEAGDRVLDVGTGSGILAIAAVKLGAARVVGVDTDELAVKTAVANADQNQVEDQFSFLARRSIQRDSSVMGCGCGKYPGSGDYWMLARGPTTALM